MLPKFIMLTVGYQNKLIHFDKAKIQIAGQPRGEVYLRVTKESKIW
jgi:hypothetical protein